ncbi:MAG: methyltransferase domain-containing protein [Clostridiales bacterium]|nr:methyltransferase domain-containing protein [Clostridiales bacterium]
MDTLNNSGTVKDQYKTSDNLDIRIAIHSRYSTNKTGFGNWIISNYGIEKGMRVLELGCGTGNMWTGKKDLTDMCSELILSDFSEGMISKAKENLDGYGNIRYQVIDIQDIPYPDDSFDMVIANMMLYHVPDLQKGLSEVRRVLKDGEKFCCATFGVNGLMESIVSMFSEFDAVSETNYNFTLQNGRDKLSPFFSDIEMLHYDDSLEVTNIEDMINYIRSLSNMSALYKLPEETIRGVLQRNMSDGILKLPKDYGMFIAR